jgi:succinate dehydrogenase/fumarate reductase-like Fe-S protein
MKDIKHVAITIYRYTAGIENEPRYQTYKVSVKGKMTILQALEYIYEEMDPTLGFRQYCCGVQYCNSCRMLVDGHSAHACLKLIEKEEYLLEPLQGYEIIKDLIVDWDRKVG